MSPDSVCDGCLNIGINGTIYKVLLSDIIYIESNKRQVTVHTPCRDYEYYHTISSLYENLKNSGFVRCHQSYLVPVDKVTAYSMTELTIGAVAVPVSRTYAGDVRKALMLSGVGAFICTKGKYKGAVIRIRPNQTIKIGRDGEAMDFVLNLPQISRFHCEITYFAETDRYEVVDYSTNGTFTGNGNRLVKGERYMLNAGTEVYFGDRELVYKLA